MKLYMVIENSYDTLNDSDSDEIKFASANKKEAEKIYNRLRFTPYSSCIYCITYRLKEIELDKSDIAKPEFVKATIYFRGDYPAITKRDISLSVWETDDEESIYRDMFNAIFCKFKIPYSDNEEIMIKSMKKGLLSFIEKFKDVNPDALLIYNDILKNR